MKKYYIKTQFKPGYESTIVSEVTEHEIKELLKNNPELLTPTPTHKRKYFVPKVGEEYWVIDELSIFIEFTNTKEDYDEINIKSGNCFATEQDAQDELNRRQAIVRIWNNYDDKYHWDIDWDNRNQTKYSITYNHEGKIIERAGYSLVSQYSTELPYFKSAEDRNQFVESNKEDLLTIFNIKK